jgi:hypothetical protein
VGGGEREGEVLLIAIPSCKWRIELAPLTGHLGNLEKNVSSHVAWNWIQGILKFTEACGDKSLVQAACWGSTFWRWSHSLEWKKLVPTWEKHDCLASSPWFKEAMALGKGLTAANPPELPTCQHI